MTLKIVALLVYQQLTQHMILKLQMSKISEIAGTDSYGTSVFALVKTTEKLGFTAKAIKGTRENLLTHFPLPAISNVFTKDNIQHYVVIHKINEKKVIICDPAKGIRKLSIDVFAGMWTGYLVILKPSYNLEGEAVT